MNQIQIDTRLYEKVINVKFYKDRNNLTLFQELKTSETGFKPKISVSGSVISNSFFNNIELRITNAFLNFDTSQFFGISIDAGYFGDKMVNGIQGDITQAYIETPGPDGVTVFVILITGQLLLKYPMDFSSMATGTYGDILSSLEGYINLYLSSPMDGTGLPSINIKYKITVPSSISSKPYQGKSVQFTGSMKDAISHVVEECLSCNFTINGTIISIYDTDTGTENAYIIDRVSVTPRALVAGHINFHAPWIPILRPGDFIYIDPEYLKVSFGAYLGFSSGTNKSYGNGYYKIYSINFDFDTVESVNSMIVDALFSDKQDAITSAMSKPLPLTA